MTGETIAISVNVVIYVIMAIGIYLVTSNYILALIQKVIMYKRLRRRETAFTKFMITLDEFIFSATGKDKNGKAFLQISIFLWLLAFALAFRFVDVWVSICMSLMAGFTPYILLRIKLERTRGKGSSEGETLVADFMSKYRISGGNVDIAIEMLIGEKKKSVCLKLMERVLAKMRESKRKEELRECASILAYSVNTNWARMLSYNIGLAAAEGTDIMPALEDILIQLREARTLQEERKRMNSESGRLILFMVPLSYVLTMIFSVNYLGTDIETLIKNQWGTSTGIILFFMIFFIFIGNMLILSIVNHKKFDY